jgi:hypothetical protein
MNFLVAFCNQERGAEKERRFVMELVHKQLEAERARIPKANPYPYTTDYPVVRKLISSPLISIIITVMKDVTITTIHICTGSTKTRAQAMHKTRAFPIGKSGEA